MTTPTETFDPHTARQLAAELVDRSLSHEEELRLFGELHTKIFTWLGADNNQVAAKLAELGITGTRPDEVDGGDYGDLVDGQGCALAVFFRTICGAASADFSTGGGTIYWDGSNGVDEYGDESVQLPPHVSEFQHGYEDFAYPQLYAGESVVRMVPSIPDSAFAFLRG